MNVNDTVNAYYEDGYVIVRKLFSPSELKVLEMELEAFIENIVPGLGDGDVYYENAPSRAIKSIFKLQKRSEVFAALGYDAKLIDIIKEILPGEITCWDVGFFGKAGRDGSVTPAHQDNAFKHYDPPHALKASLALDAQTDANGVFTCLKKSHSLGLLPHRPSGVMSFSQCLIDDVDTTLYPEEKMYMEPGDVAFHHTNTVHLSGANQTDQPRRMFSLSYISSLVVRNEEESQRVATELKAMHARYDRPD